MWLRSDTHNVQGEKGRRMKTTLKKCVVCVRFSDGYFFFQKCIIYILASQSAETRALRRACVCSSALTVISSYSIVWQEMH